MCRKSSIARLLAERLLNQGRLVEVLDGDVVRQSLSYGLGFSHEDRERNVRRVGFVANLLSRNGVVVVVALVSPYRAIRAEVRATIGRFIEVHVDCPLPECKRRDVKGMYISRPVRAGSAVLPGSTTPMSPRRNPDHAQNQRETVEESAGIVLGALRGLGYGLDERCPRARRTSASECSSSAFGVQTSSLFFGISKPIAEGPARTRLGAVEAQGCRPRHLIHHPPRRPDLHSRHRPAQKRHRIPRLHQDRRRIHVRVAHDEPARRQPPQGALQFLVRRRPPPRAAASPSRTRARSASVCKRPKNQRPALESAR